MAAKRRNRINSPAASAPVDAVVSSPSANASNVQGKWAAPIYGTFFFFLFAACSPALDSKFALPKLVVLASATLVLSLLLIVRHWRGRTITTDPVVLLLAFALGGWWIISTPFALHIPTALDGEYDWYNGLWTHLCWLALFVASMCLLSDRTTSRRIIWLLVSAIAFVALVNLMNAAGLYDVGLARVSVLGDQVASSALMNFAIPFVVVSLLKARHWGIRAGLAALVALLVVSELLSLGRGAWVGLFVAIVVLSIGLVSSAARWKVAVSLIFAVIALAGVAVKVDPDLTQRFTSLTQLTQDPSLNQRFMYYRAAVRVVRDHPLVGIGFENFRNSYPAYRGAEDFYFFQNIIPTMVHNGYLEAAANNGIPGLLLYLALIGAVMIRLGRNLAKEEGTDRRHFILALLAVLSAYLVQDLTGWLSMGLTPIFWVVLGLAASQTSESIAASFSRWRKPLIVTFSGITILLSLYLLNDGYARVLADSRLFEAKALDVSTQWSGAESRVRQALAVLPGDSRTEATAAHVYINRFVASHDPAAYTRAHELLEASYGHNPFDRLRLVNLVALENLALGLGQIKAPSDFAQKAIVSLAKTDADNPAFHEFNAKFAATQGRFDEALAAIREARRLVPQDTGYQAMQAEYERALQRR